MSSLAYPPLVLQTMVKRAPSIATTTMSRRHNDNNKVRDDDKDAMPPKEVWYAATAKKPTAATAMTLPDPRPLAIFFGDSTDKFAIA